MANKDERQIFIGEFQKNAAQTIKAHLVPWKRDVYADVRVFEKNAEGVEHPCVWGIRIDVELIPDLIRLLEQAKEAAQHEQMKIAAMGGAKRDPDPAMPEHGGAKGSIRRRLW
jgi:hypothetical protein